jgi:hypothetical protein
MGETRACRIDTVADSTLKAPGEKYPRGVFAFASSPPLAKFPRGNFLAAI